MPEALQAREEYTQYEARPPTYPETRFATAERSLRWRERGFGTRWVDHGNGRDSRTWLRVVVWMEHVG